MLSQKTIPHKPISNDQTREGCVTNNTTNHIHDFIAAIVF